MSGLLVIVFFALALVAGASLLVSLGNLRSFRRLEGGPGLKAFPRLSVLIPARNEERNIERCLDALAQQRYPNMEILVLDDHSEDGTAALVEAAVRRDGRVRLLRGKAVPRGWLGKHWACHQLVLAASGELVLFVDADTKLGPEVVSDAVEAMCAERADLVSVLPTRVARPWPDRLMYAVLAWANLAWLPMGLAHSSHSPYLSATFGPFMLFRREAYDRIGGHAAVRSNPLDDFELGRGIKRAGLRWRLFDATGRVFTDDYTTAREAMDGLSRSIFPVFRFSIAAFVLVWVGFAALGLAPIAVVALALAGRPVDPIVLRLSSATIVLLLTSWGLASIRFDFNRFLAILYPLPVLMTLYLGLRSMLRTVMEKNTWKGRLIRGLGPARHSGAGIGHGQNEGVEADDATAPEMDRRDISRL